MEEGTWDTNLQYSYNNRKLVHSTPIAVTKTNGTKRETIGFAYNGVDYHPYHFKCQYKTLNSSHAEVEKIFIKNSELVCISMVQQVS